MKSLYLLSVVLILAGGCREKVPVAQKAKLADHPTVYNDLAVKTDTARVIIDTAGSHGQFTSMHGMQYDPVKNDLIRDSMVQEVMIPDLGKMHDKSYPHLIKGVLPLNLVFPKRKNSVMVTIPYSLQITAGTAGAIIRFKPTSDSITVNPLGGEWGRVTQYDRYQNVYTSHAAQAYTQFQEKRIVLYGENGAHRLMPTDDFSAYKYGQQLDDTFKVKDISSAYNQYFIDVVYTVNVSYDSKMGKRSYFIKAFTKAEDLGIID